MEKIKVNLKAWTSVPVHPRTTMSQGVCHIIQLQLHVLCPKPQTYPPRKGSFPLQTSVPTYTELAIGLPGFTVLNHHVILYVIPAITKGEALWFFPKAPQPEGCSLFPQVSLHVMWAHFRYQSVVPECNRAMGTSGLSLIFISASINNKCCSSKPDVSAWPSVLFHMRSRTH